MWLKAEGFKRSSEELVDGHQERGGALQQLGFRDSKEREAALFVDEAEARRATETDIKEGVTRAFLSLLSDAEDWTLNINGLGFMALESEDARSLENPFSKEDVGAALSSLCRDKGPRPYGFTMPFLLLYC
ncbi:hypothetical protein AAG906_034755 [Vitis piasezkii]